MNTNTFLTPKARRAAFSCARGPYQTSLIADQSSWAGSDLRGNAKSYATKYRDSRWGLIRRLRENDELAVEETTGARGRSVVVIMTKAERRRVGRRPIIEAASRIIERDAQARERAKRKAAREAARNARNFAEDLPSLVALAAA